jgi:alkyl sulfatase BDS1-like metallo-beta-lactamase superfamily hydrolase
VKVRDTHGKKSELLNEALNLYADRSDTIASPPLALFWAKRSHWLAVRTARYYRYLHDQTVRMMNKA